METTPKRRAAANPRRRTAPPRGREAVMAAVRAAAVDLLADQGPRDVTVRAVAERAGVNHALIHRHFGTKDALVRAVVTEQSRALADRAAQLPQMDAAAMLRLLREHEAYWRILARIVLDAPDLLSQEQLPAASAALAAVTGGRSADETTRVAAAVAASTALGWLVFGPHLAHVLDVADPSTFDEQVGETLRRVVRGGVSRRRGGPADPAG